MLIGGANAVQVPLEHGMLPVQSARQTDPTQVARAPQSVGAVHERPTMAGPPTRQ